VLPKDHTSVAKLQKEEIRSAIERVAQFADERSRAIRVQFTKGECASSLPRWKPARAKRA
jgi:DNA polymerase-3 subunit beta